MKGRLRRPYETVMWGRPLCGEDKAGVANVLDLLWGPSPVGLVFGVHHGRPGGAGRVLPGPGDAPPATAGEADAHPQPGRLPDMP